MQLLLLSPIIFLITYIGSKFNNNRHYRNKKQLIRLNLRRQPKKHLVVNLKMKLDSITQVGITL